MNFDDERLRRLNTKVDILSAALNQYHSTLEQSLRQRTSILHNAAWALTFIVIPPAIMILIGLFFKESISLDNWLFAGIFGVVATAVWLCVGIWLGGLKQKESEEMGELPSWQDLIEELESHND